MGVLCCSSCTTTRWSPPWSTPGVLDTFPTFRAVASQETRLSSSNRIGVTAAGRGWLHKAGPNNAFKPNALRYTKHMAERACHVFGSATHVGLTSVLGAT